MVRQPVLVLREEKVHVVEVGMASSVLGSLSNVLAFRQYNRNRSLRAWIANGFDSRRNHGAGQRLIQSCRG